MSRTPIGLLVFMMWFFGLMIPTVWIQVKVDKNRKNFMLSLIYPIIYFLITFILHQISATYYQKNKLYSSTFPIDYW